MMSYASLYVIARAELRAQLDAGTAPLIIDVRSRWEYHRGHVPGAVHIPFWTLFFHRAAIPTTPDEPI